MPNIPSLYVHIPFCTSKCRYCDFASGVPPVTNSVETYAEMLIRELRSYGRHKLSTVYFGGGTPSLLPPAVFESLANAVRDAFRLEPDAEWTVEANPNDLTPELATLWRDCGVNRISLGVQSMNPEVLKFLGRRNTPSDNARAMDVLREAGFGNVGIDWILAVDERETGMNAFIERYRPEHVSAYLLSVEEGTLLKEMARRGEYVQPGDEESLRQYWETAERLTGEGYVHYEISNFARSNGCRSRHNSNYWNYGSYIGAGMAASGFALTGFDPPFGIRRTNFSGFSKYVESMKQGLPPHEFSEDIDLATAKREFVMLGLRKIEGFELTEYERFFGEPFPAKDVLSPGVTLIQPKDGGSGDLSKCLVPGNGRLRLTREGIGIMNRVVLKIWEQMEKPAE